MNGPPSKPLKLGLGLGLGIGLPLLIGASVFAGYLISRAKARKAAPKQMEDPLRDTESVKDATFAEMRH